MKHLVALLFFLSSCGMFNKQLDEIPAVDVSELQIIDSEFSDFSKQHGMRKAFLEYIADDGVIMRDQTVPLEGAHAIDWISAMDDSAVSLIWEPQGGDIAASGDLGYTYGIYEMRDSLDNVQRGSYVTIWKRQNGKWKFVLDSGNQGLGDQSGN